MKKAAIVYCSPNGATRHIAGIIKEELERSGISVLCADLGTGDDISPIMAEAEKGNLCLFTGSPVYANHPVPPVMRFISKLPESDNAWAAPFVTWGAVSSGIALYDMGKALMDKGFALAGAAKTAAVHSMMWRSENPLGQGRPNEEDENMIREFVSQIVKKLTSGTLQPLSLSDLAYQPEPVHREMEKVSLELAKGHMPARSLNADLCTKCLICLEICPVEAITLTPYPQFSDECICCFQCAKNCPEEAIEVDLSQIEGYIRNRAEEMNEQPLTAFFV